eukprot:6676706-Heterocapsa_arctica.AAC.1
MWQDGQGVLDDAIEGCFSVLEICKGAPAVEGQSGAFQRPASYRSGNEAFTAGCRAGAGEAGERGLILEP